MKTIKRIKVHVTRSRIAEGDEVYSRSVRSSRDVAAIARAVLRGEDQEVFLCFHLDNKHKVLGYTEVSRGSISDAAVHPREAFRAAILQGAAAVVFAHNHPSGDPEPSASDVAITARLHAGGKLLGINVLDHVVIGDGAHASFLDAGKLPS